MDLNRFFSFFNDRSDSDRLEENLTSFKKTPYFKIGVFTKLIMNGLSFKKQVIMLFENSDGNMDMRDVDLMGEFMMYQRAWYWISQLDWTDEEWLNDLRRSSNDKLLTAVKLSINFFEDEEEFEKCAFLKKIQDFVEDYLETIE
jgi:hypothetical protein